MVTAMSWYVVSMGVNCIPSSLRACKPMYTTETVMIIDKMCSRDNLLHTLVHQAVTASLQFWWLLTLH